MEDRRRRERENAAGPGDEDNLDNSDGDEDNLDGDNLDDYNDDHGNEDNNVHGDGSIITVIYRPGNPNLMRNFLAALSSSRSVVVCLSVGWSVRRGLCRPL